uniref:SH2 domain-containing protein n=1 Tax=Parascaris univalens TaxID=6257 RepID=A0A914ZZD9_PARUN
MCRERFSKRSSEVQYYHEWEVNYKYNIIYGTTSSYPARAIKNDTMPGMKQPSPTVAFIRVRRTNTGRFYLFDTDKETFYTIYQLLNYYTEQKLTLDMDSAVALRRPAELHSLPISGLKPIEIPIPARAYKSPRHMLGLILVPDRKDTSYSIHILDESEKPSFSGRMCRALLIAEGSNYIVALKRIRSSMVRKSSMQRDLNLLFLERRKQNDHLDEKNRNIYFIQGEEYLCKIAGFGFNDEIHGTWVAYEFVNGSPLSSVLTMRKTDGMPPLTIRANFEIMYQVAAGMRYLEDNGLCHRCLRSSNILVSVEYEFALAVKITDYMLPYHVLNDPTQDVDVSELHWKWMGIGALDRLVFDIKADVWSFGCVMFEILNPGHEPYAFEQTPIDSPKSLLKFLSKGKRMKVQNDDDGRVPNFISTLMSCCWLQEPAQRPTFARIFTFFYDLLFDFANGCNKAICEYQNEKGGIGTTANILTKNVGKQRRE